MKGNLKLVMLLIGVLLISPLREAAAQADVRQAEVEVNPVFFFDAIVYSSDQPGDSFVQLNLLLGYRFARRRAEVTFGIWNLTDSDYALSPLTYYSELPRERIFSLGVNFQL